MHDCFFFLKKYVTTDIAMIYMPELLDFQFMREC